MNIIETKPLPWPVKLVVVIGDFVVKVLAIAIAAVFGATELVGATMFVLGRIARTEVMHALERYLK